MLDNVFVVYACHFSLQVDAVVERLHEHRKPALLGNIFLFYCF